MGLDFELKISPTRDDDPSSTFQLQLAKSTATPSFWSNETNSMFILTAKLTAINGSGTRIEISSGYPVQKMEITRWTYKKETEARRLMKIFRIPDGVVLDEITATYDEESILMPKSVDGILGVGIEEVKEQEVDEEAFVSQDYEAEEIPRTTAELETLETARKTKVVEDNHGNEEDDTINGEVEEENAEHGAYPKIEYVEKEATRENVNGEIKVPKVRSMEGIEVAEDSSQGTANHQKEIQLDANAYNGDDITTMINKKPDVKIESQASINREAQVLDRELTQPNRQTRREPGKQETHKSVRELKEPETNKEPGDIKSPYLQSSAHEHEEKGVDQQDKSFQPKDEIKEAREECKSPNETHEDSSKDAKQEKKTRFQNSLKCVLQSSLQGQLFSHPL